MSHFKGRQNAKAVEHDFSHFVEVVVAPNGLGPKLAPCKTFKLATAFSPCAVMAGHDANVGLSAGALLTE